MTQAEMPVHPPHSLGSGLHALSAKWGWIFALGVLFLVSGFVALGSVVTATVASVLVVGWMMIIAGIGEIIHAFAVKTWGRLALWLALGVLYVLGGVSIFINPLLAAGILTLFLGAALVASGILRIVLAFQMKVGTPWIAVALSGLVTVLLGGIILFHWPVSSLFVLGVFLGFDLILIGVGWMTMGLALRRHRPAK